ncbi:SDR family NAD(P)-dependent oxidoreductase [Nocardioides immobilis]|uniref:SDR family NAD(P)-dependent oxidoreductase n=1 Tax=Nocardioides immobilis TaxID=2049295 RepID=A0A417XTD6_9ACTN|nr:SDR family NAD(P)-dependent oxidoreductase [Nocardioides immobilis]RHW23764.1 SDR family NAD(P)-dependent oxidoreductase [Nocardioides immobilis]
MDNKLAGTVAVVTGASSGIGAATARRLSEHGAAVVLVARRRERLDALVAQIGEAGGAALAIEADLAVREHASRAIQEAVDHYGRLDILVNNAGLMLLGPVVGADTDEWDRMLAINVQGLMYATHAALPHLLAAAEDGLREVADIVNVGSIAGRLAWRGYAAYNTTKFGVHAFSEALRQEVTRRHVRVGLLEPGAVATELVSHNSAEVRKEMTDAFDARVEKLEAEDIADGIAYMVTRSHRTTIADMLILPTEQD